MATLTIRNLDDNVKQALRERAARHGRSMEEEARVLIGQGVKARDGQAARNGEASYRRIRELVEPVGGIEIPALMRKPASRPVPFQDAGPDSE